MGICPNCGSWIDEGDICGHCGGGGGYYSIDDDELDEFNHYVGRYEYFYRQAGHAL